MNKWVKLLVSGLVISVLFSTIFLLVGWSQGSDSLLYLSIGATALGGILFWVGLIGFLVDHFRRAATQKP